MSGPNQHFIPRFVQKPFGIPPKRNEIWCFSRGEPAEIKRVKRAGSEDFFYTDEVDQAITDAETPLSRLLNAIRSTGLGDFVDPAAASDAIVHLAPRTAHFRATMERGLRQLGASAADLMSDADAIQAMMGLSQDAPNPVFQARMADTLRDQPEIAELGLPMSVIERVAFYIAKENFSTAVGDSLPVFRSVFTSWISKSDELARDSHNKALAGANQPNARDEFLRGLSWTIEPAPPAGAILPDCVTLALTADGESAPFMLADRKDIQAVIMPVSREKLLIGLIDHVTLPADFDFNAAAARSSHSFFLAPVSDEETSRLHSMIGERSTLIIEEAIRDVIGQFTPLQPTPMGEDDPLIEQGATGNDSADAPPWQYELSLLECGEQETTDRIVDAVRSAVAELAKGLPLRRLDGITIAYDYPAALAAVDRGFENANPAQTISEEIGVGIAQMVTVKRNGEVKGRVVMSSSIAYALIDDDPAQVEWAIHVFVKELAQVAMIEIIEHALPGAHLMRIEDELDYWLYANVDAALHAYVTSYIAAGFGDPEDIASSMRQIAVRSIERMRSAILEERLSYRYHGDLDRLVGVAFPTIRNALTFLADLLGQCAATGASPFDEDGALAGALEQAGLTNWFSIYRGQLEAFRQKIGRWQSFDDFLAFNVHVERLLWQHGMLPWKGPEGLRLEVPLGTDAAALIAAHGGDAA